MKVYTSIDAWNKMSYWAALGGKEHREFTCFGRAHHDDGDLYVTDVYLVKQEGTSAGVDGDDEDINRLMMELYAKGIEPDEAFRCWIHSHPGTGPTATYLSGTDDANIERYLTGQWLISIVLDAKGGNPFCQVDVKEPRQSLKTELEVLIPAMADATMVTAKEEFDEKSSGRVWTPGKGQSGHVGSDGTRHYGGYGGYSGDSGSYSGGRYPHSGSGGGYARGGYSGPSGSGEKEGDSGKANGVGQSGKRNGTDAGKSGSRGTGAQTELDGMLMLGAGFVGDEDEYDAWLEYLTMEDHAGIPTQVVTSDTEEISEIEVGNSNEVEVQVLTADSVPEWVVSMADKMACTVEDLCQAVDVKRYDGLIDELVLQVQCGFVLMDAAVDDLEKMGISKEVATKELDTRVNA